MMFFIVSSGTELSERRGNRNSEFLRDPGSIEPRGASDLENSCCGAVRIAGPINLPLTKKHGIAFVFQRHRQVLNDIAPVFCCIMRAWGGGHDGA
jgi:hypothetical protein